MRGEEEECGGEGWEGEVGLQGVMETRRQESEADFRVYLFCFLGVFFAFFFFNPISFDQKSNSKHVFLRYEILIPFLTIIEARGEAEPSF